MLAVVAVVASLSASVHILLFKRHTRAAMGWLGVVWLSPGLGVMLYAVLGINRLRRIQGATAARLAREPEPQDPEVEPPHLEALARLVRRVSRRTLRAGNKIELLENGEVAYPAMLAAIDGAQESVSLAMYILDTDREGFRFLDALERAMKRGVQVRVLIDGLGARYSWPRSSIRILRARGVPVAPFSWSIAPSRIPTLNLRNHRKALVVDGRVGFTGGMNIRAHAMRDLMVRVTGPVVRDLQRVFAEDWALATDEILDESLWFPASTETGGVLARVLPDGPDGDLGVASWTLFGALATARESVRIATPYFLPEEELEAALKTTAMRGVRVDLLIPEHSNLRYMDWAARAELGGLIDRGVRVWLAPGPFDHSKLMIVDDAWTRVGSTNWDPRSLRLNFELDLEAYDRDLATRAIAVFEGRKADARALTSRELADRGLLARLRDRTIWLFRPYL